MDWPLGEAKNKFSQVFDKALKDGPQRIVRRGKDKAVLISEADYRRTRTASARRWTSSSIFFRRPG
jgi:prevent-host-death family protein